MTVYVPVLCDEVVQGSLAGEALTQGSYKAHVAPMLLATLQHRCKPQSMHQSQIHNQLQCQQHMNLAIQLTRLVLLTVDQPMIPKQVVHIANLLLMNVLVLYRTLWCINVHQVGLDLQPKLSALPGSLSVASSTVHLSLAG